MFVDAGVFLDKGIRRRHVGFGLIIVVITDEIFDCVMRKEFFKFPVKLRRKRFVWGQDNRRLLYALNNIGDRVSFARASNAQQCLVRQASIKALNQVLDRLRLIARGLVVAD